jgi:hypothetical protein
MDLGVASVLPRCCRHACFRAPILHRASPEGCAPYPLFEVGLQPFLLRAANLVRRVNLNAAPIPRKKALSSSETHSVPQALDDVKNTR